MIEVCISSDLPTQKLTHTVTISYDMAAVLSIVNSPGLSREELRNYLFEYFDTVQNGSGGLRIYPTEPLLLQDEGGRIPLWYLPLGMRLVPNVCPHILPTIAPLMRDSQAKIFECARPLDPEIDSIDRGTGLDFNLTAFKVSFENQSHIPS